MSAPRTSIILPAYNAEDTLRESVESALAQTVGDFELIVVDDASRIPAAEVIDGVGDERIRIIRFDENRRVAAARNTAIAAARAPLLSQLDADDAWEPGYLETILPCFDSDEVGLAYANATVLGNPEAATYVAEPARQPIDTFPDLAEGNPVPATTVTMRADAVRAVGGYASWIWAGTDYHLYLKLAAAGWRFAYVDELLARYRAPDITGGMTANRKRAARSELKMWIGFSMRHPLLPMRRHRRVWRAARRAARETPAAQRMHSALRRGRQAADRGA
jgi:glycosyltransferase involved in cell wall biosynthesis